MPKTTKNGDARTDEIPSTLQRSDEKAQRTFAKAHDSAMDSYDDEQRANQVAWAAVKHTHEKVATTGRRKQGVAARPTPRPRAAGTPTTRPRAASTPTPPRTT
jgi:cation transport regulator ChaB